MATEAAGLAAALSSDSLSSLRKLDKQSYITSFLNNQRTYRDIHYKEGRTQFKAWDRGSPGSRSSRLPDHDQATSRQPPIAQFSTTATPVLKARNPNIAVRDDDPNNATPACTKPRDKIRNTVEEEQENMTSQSQKHPRNTRKRQQITEISTRGADPPTGRKRAYSASSQVSSVKARLHQRKEKKRQRREIMKPALRKSDLSTTSNESCKRNQEIKAKSSPKKDKKSKLPVGLALIHGFSATNVGKNRLTVKPMMSSGVFSKGRASGRITTSGKKKKNKNIQEIGEKGFSEFHLLNAPPVLEGSGCTPTDPSETMKVSKNKSHNAKPQKLEYRQRKPVITRATSERESSASSLQQAQASRGHSDEVFVAQSVSRVINNSRSSSSDSAQRNSSPSPAKISVRKPNTRANKLDTPSSLSKDQDITALPPQSLLLSTRKFSWGEHLVHDQESGSAKERKISFQACSSVMPHDSASQIRFAPPPSKPPVYTTSKYFQPSEQHDHETEENEANPRLDEPFAVSINAPRQPSKKVTRATSKISESPSDSSHHLPEASDYPQIFIRPDHDQPCNPPSVSAAATSADIPNDPIHFDLFQPSIIAEHTYFRSCQQYPSLQPSYSSPYIQAIIENTSTIGDLDECEYDGHHRVWQLEDESITDMDVELSFMPSPNWASESAFPAQLDGLEETCSCSCFSIGGDDSAGSSQLDGVFPLESEPLTVHPTIQYQNYPEQDCGMDSCDGYGREDGTDLDLDSSSSSYLGFTQDQGFLNPRGNTTAHIQQGRLDFKGITAVEEDIARRMQGHWHAQRL